MGSIFSSKAAGSFAQRTDCGEYPRLAFCTTLGPRRAGPTKRPDFTADDLSSFRVVGGPAATEPAREIPALALSGENALEESYQYLAAHLAFPFPAHRTTDGGPGIGPGREVSVLGLVEPAPTGVENHLGVFCTIRQGDTTLALPLAELDVPETDPNHAIIEQYDSCYFAWFWDGL